MSGKQARIPQCKAGFQWGGGALKELAGSGCVYIGLVKDVGDVSEASSSDEFPPAFSGPKDSSSGSSVASDSATQSTSSSAASVSRTASTSYSAQSTSASTSSSTSRTASTSSSTSHTASISASTCRTLSTSYAPSSAASTSRTVSTLYSPSTSLSAASTSYSVPSTSRNSVSTSLSVGSISPICIDDDDSCPLQSESSDAATDIAKMVEVFSNMDESQLKYLYALSNSSFSRTVDCALDGPSLESLRSLALTQLTTPLEESPRIRLEEEDDEQDWVDAALAFYKQAKFNKQAYVRISIRGQPGIDTGGIRRQFFNVFSMLAQPSTSLSFFEGLPNRLRPAFKASTLSSGMLNTIGTMIVHSILLDGQGFPFIADYCCYYMAGDYDHAITCITL